MNVSAPKALCPNCNQMVSITKDKVIRNHQVSRTSTQTCKGSYKKIK